MSYDTLVTITIQADGCLKDGSTYRRPEREDVIRVLSTMLAEVDGKDYHLQWVVDRLDYCLSGPLEGGKGRVLILSGGFNGWQGTKVMAVAERLSRELTTHVMATSVDQEVWVMHAGYFTTGIPRCATQRTELLES